MKIWVILIAVLSPILIILLIAGKIFGRKKSSVAIDRTGDSDGAHEGVVDSVLDEIGVMSLGLEREQEAARANRLDAEEKVMEEDDGRETFHGNVDAAADVGSVDTLLQWRDDRRGKD